MKKELDDNLCKDFPLLYKDRHGDARSTAMCWGFQCGDGWYNILYKLSSGLEELLLKFKTTSNNCECYHPFFLHQEKCNYNHRGVVCNCGKFEPYVPRATTVKEKFGGLRFYMSHMTDEMDELIEWAENASLTTCENCGEAGEVQQINGWLYCRCKDCFKKLK